jgi:hypothetical protein
MRHALATTSAIMLIAGAFTILPPAGRLSAQECTGPDCASPGGHQCEREKKEAPTA